MLLCTCIKMVILIDLGKGQIALCPDTRNTAVHIVQFLILMSTLEDLNALLHAIIVDKVD